MTPRLYQRLDKTWTQFRKIHYIALEILLSRIMDRRSLRILFSDEEGAKPLIEKGFRKTRHSISFGQFTRDTIEKYDLIVPLTIADIDRLNEHRPLIDSNPIPIPSDQCVRLCDDKILFNGFLRENGYAEVIPRTDEDFGYPYILKRRVDDTGKNSTFILDKLQEEEVLRGLSREDYFTQEIIPGSIEFASHVLFMDGRIVRSLSFEYRLGDTLLVKGKHLPVEQRIIPCPFTELFTSILNAIGFEGLCCIDYKIQDNRPYIMEINPRFGGSLRLYFFSFIRNLKLSA